MISSLTFVIPTYATAATLPELIDEIVHVAPTLALQHQVVVIDDACPEQSGVLVAGTSGVRVFRSERNHGQRTAVLAGLAMVDSAVACVMDADLQDDPESVGTLLEVLAASGADVACAGRSGGHQSVGRRAQASAFRHVRWWASGRAIPPDARLFHVATAGAVRAMLLEAVPGDDPLVAYARSDARIVSVPVPRRPRPTGRSSYTSLTRMRMAARSIRGLRKSPPARQTWPSLHEIQPTESP